MIYGFDEEELAAARLSRSGEIAKNWKLEDIEKYIQQERIYSVDVLPDKSLYVSFALVPPGTNHMGVMDDFIVEPSAPSYQNFLQMSGISEPGQSKSFK
ncbi:MAG: hypothetical protein IPG59_01800 [Candidatus Melainabacteria bacterium]|nr:MAG: hypothetical protein IPG59_01800 [Candidatus Melainabacteria bacterium]